MSITRISCVNQRWTASCCMLLAIVACQEERATPAADTESPQTDLVQWLFIPSPEERRALDSLLGVLHARYSPARPLLSGQIDTLPGESSHRRYLLIAPVRGAADTVDSIKLFILTLQTLSEPSPTSIVDHPNRFAVTSVTDLDDDGLADVAYCTWEGSPGTEGTPQAIGYRDGRWYEIGDASVPECGPLPAP